MLRELYTFLLTLMLAVSAPVNTNEDIVTVHVTQFHTNHVEVNCRASGESVICETSGVGNELNYSPITSPTKGSAIGSNVQTADLSVLTSSSKSDTEVGMGTYRTFVPTFSASSAISKHYGALSSSYVSSSRKFSFAASSNVKSSSESIDSSSSFSSVSSSTSGNYVPKNTFFSTIEKLWERFWLNNSAQWTDNDSICGQKQSSVVVWEQAVAGRAITDSKNFERIELIMTNINQYRNENLGAYSSGTGGSEDIYTDDNGQLAWVFVDAYKITQSEDYLNNARGIVDFSISQKDDKGGIIWKYKENYIASISTVETALAAARVFEITQDEQYLNFSRDCMDYMFEYLQDPSDKLFYDGLSKNDYDDVNKGKLTYTVGCALSTLTLLHQYTNDTRWLTKVSELASSATNQNGAFYNEKKLWNNDLKYVHLLFAGFADLLTSIDLGVNSTNIREEVIRQGSFIYNYLQDSNDESLYFNSVTQGTSALFNRFKSIFGDNDSFSESPDIHCDGDLSKPTKKVFMDNASAAQILFEVGRLL